MSEDNLKYLPISPYPGIKPFSFGERNVFFARVREIRALIRLIVLHRGVLLYSESGTGKSSFINAGLMKRAIEENYQPERIRIQPQSDGEIIVERISVNADSTLPYLPSIFSEDDEQDRIVMSVDTFLETLTVKGKGNFPLLIFDQFEEWITLFEEGKKRKRANRFKFSQKKVKNAIVEIINDHTLPVKVLLSFREDYLARMSPIFDLCPDLPDQFLQLKNLHGDDILKIIRGPFEEYPEKYLNAIDSELAQIILTQFEERKQGTAIRLSEVQIVCRSLYDSFSEEHKYEEIFESLGGVQGILENYLERSIEKLPDYQKDPSIALLSRLVTMSGTRNVISEGDLLDYVKLENDISVEILKETLTSLEQDARLVRKELRREVYYYEIISEFLIEWIRKKSRQRQNQKRISEYKLENEEKEERLKIERKKLRRARYLSVFGISLSVISILAFVIAFENYIKSEENYRLLNEEKKERLNLEIKELFETADALKDAKYYDGAIKFLDSIRTLDESKPTKIRIDSLRVIYLSSKTNVE